MGSNLVDLDEIITLGGEDPQFYSQHWFPKTVRQVAPEFHTEIWTELDDPLNRLVAIRVFRGGAKTTLLRLFASRRIAYSISRTIVFLSAAQKHALASLDWLRGAVEFNKPWANAFGLSKGTKWAGDDIEIYHAVDNVTIRVIALGMTGQLRGFNFQDHRPDLIIPDDPGDDENQGTLEQRAKSRERFYGALVPSLAPQSEIPDAKITMLQTPIAVDDLVETAAKDKAWKTLTFGCFDENGESRWPARWSTQELLAMKQSYIDRNLLPVWMREYECKIVSDETSRFRMDWLKYYDTIPTGGRTYLAIDPAPPETERDLAGTSRKAKNRSWQAVSVVRAIGGDVYLCAYDRAKGEAIDEFITKIVSLIYFWRPQAIGVETIAYQKTLKWLLERTMQQHKLFLPVYGLEDRRSKPERITQTIMDIAVAGRLHVNKSQTEFLEEYAAYPNVRHPDLLDSTAMAIYGATLHWEGTDEEFVPLAELAQKVRPELADWRAAP